MHHDRQHSCAGSSTVTEPAPAAGVLSAAPLLPGGGLPVVVTSREPRRLEAWAADVRRAAEAWLPVYGGILFRGLPIGSAVDFEIFVGAFTPALVSYEFGSTPRSRVHRQVYTSTEYPSHQSIPLHNEQAYTTDWPMKIWFYCGQAPEQGGETPIADSRQVFARMPPQIRKQFADRGVMYVRNYGNGLDVPWQQVFNTTDRTAVERFCRDSGIAYEWKADGELRTRQVAQAIAVHPRTNETVWFNQAHLFHVSNLDPSVREALVAAVGEEDLPRNAYYGDGRPIEPEVLDEIRAVYREVAVQFPWQAGDVLMLDNMLAAHGRAPFTGRRQILVAMAEPYGATQPCR